MKHPSQRSNTLVTLAILALVLGACGGSPAATTPSSTAAASVSGAATATPVPNLGTLKINESATAPFENAYLYAAIDNGYFKEVGLTIQLVPSANDQTHEQLFISGQIDIMKNGVPAATTVALKAGGKVIDTTLKNYPFVLVGPKSMTTIKDLEGKTLGISAPGAVSEIIPKLVMAKLGGDPSKVKVAPVGGTAARLAAIVAGKVDATALLGYQVDSALAQAPTLHIVQDLYSQLSDNIAGGAIDVVSADTIKNRSEALKAYLIAFTRGQRFVYEHPAETALIVEKRYPDQKPADVEAAFNLYAKSQLVPINPEVTQTIWDATMKTLFDFKQIPSAAPFTVVDGSFAANAIQKLGRANYK